MTSIYNSTTTTLLVDTTSARKIVFLPVASTVGAGRLLWIKDISGNAATSSIFISTIGMDRIENRFMPSTICAIVSSSYGSVLMTTDGILNWYFLQHYYRNAVLPDTRFTSTPRLSLQATTYSGSGTWYDSSPNGFNATLENGTIAKNAEGNGIVLNGSTNWIFNDIAAGNLWTCCVWYKNTGAIVGSNPCILAQIYIGNHININLGYGANIGYSFHVGGVGWAQGTTISITNSAWTNYYGVWNGTTLSTYINGAFQGSTTPGQTSSSAGSQYRIGRRWDSADYMVGQIGEVVVFNTTAFTATQVANDYTFRRSTYGV